MVSLPAGRRARVRVPATSANLGPGFDCMGLAVDLVDELSAEVLEEGVEVQVTGEGADQVPRDGSHLVVRVLTESLAELGSWLPGVRLDAHNVIPHSRGLGSSAAAIVAGLALAWGLARPGEPLDLDWACRVSTRYEGHPDNACAAVLGGIVLAWPGVGDDVEVVRLEAAPGLRVIAWVPGFEVRTAGARQVLPVDVPRVDALAQAISSALLVHALTKDPSKLLDGTRDRLHQPYRAPLMQPSADLMAELRSQGIAAFISGAGPTVLAMGTPDQLAAAEDVRADGFTRHDLSLGRGVEILRG
ncbi:homoserine kinase [Luteococcus japonicus]|uniref:Homoserine kinase n=1 Tax=Luteococcus japonicus LSP_Lj1 TaxID=1255658 RepID=A0A1R4JLS9_9ACTN|nr:homoserine kinase [Luteococcus japonicus]SJN33211.1 Homoserine kinase [Luteococcus japonicus LSP_Lj1]